MAVATDTCVGETVHYLLTPQVATGRIRVELTWNPGGRTQSALIVSPQWGTVPSVPDLIRGMEVKGASVTPTDKTRWLLQHPPNAEITCRYEVDPGRRELTWEAMHYPVTTATFFHGIGHTFLLVPQAGGGLPSQYDVTLRWQLPEGWKAVCSWATGTHVGAVLAPAELRNAVYLAGRLSTHTEQREGRSVTAALVSRFGFNSEQLADMAAAIIARQCAFMGEQDFPPYLLTAVPVGEPVKPGDTRLAGMGLHRSFALFAAPQAELTDAAEHLFAHELFHYWNGGVLKARQPDKLVYWFIEGFTDYYALRILFESKYWQPDAYAKWINRHLREYRRNPAIHASNEDILARYWQERDTVGEVPYQRGLLLGLRWHRLARDRSIPDGVDRLFLGLVQRARRGDFELSNELIRQTGVESLGSWFGAEFDRYVRDAETIEVPQTALAPELIGRYRPVYDFELGFDRQGSVSQRRVQGVIPGSAAERAGLRDGDELAGWKLHSDPDVSIELRVRRDGQAKTVQYYPRGKSRELLQFEPADGGPREKP